MTSDEDERVGERDTPAMREGARNLLVNCAGVEAEDQILVVREDARHGYYDDDAPACVEREAERLGARVHAMRTPLIEGPDDVPAVLGAAMEHVDHTIFFSRIGDQMRFYPLPGPGTKTMCYALDAGFLGEEACRVPYGLMTEVLGRVQAELSRAKRWRVQCPLGTDIQGESDPAAYAAAPSAGFTVRLFPLGPFRTFACDSATGRLVTRWFPPSATHRYDPYGIAVEEPVALLVREGRIVDFEGEPACTAVVREHYARVSSQLGIDPFVVHSWHGGTNPKIFYPRPAEQDVERWNGVMHSHPRYAHFHTCGGYNPGEIIVPIIDPTITIDDEIYWDRGRLVFLERSDIRALLDEFPAAPNAFEMRMDIGL